MSYKRVKKLHIKGCNGTIIQSPSTCYGTCLGDGKCSCEFVRGCSCPEVSEYKYRKIKKAEALAAYTKKQKRDRKTLERLKKDWPEWFVCESCLC